MAKQQTQQTVLEIEGMSLEVHDHVLVTPAFGDARSAFVTGTEPDPISDVPALTVLYEGTTNETEWIASKSAIRAMISKPVPNCDCFSCAQARQAAAN